MEGWFQAISDQIRTTGYKLDKLDDMNETLLRLEKTAKAIDSGLVEMRFWILLAIAYTVIPKLYGWVGGTAWPWLVHLVQVLQP